MDAWPSLLPWLLPAYLLLVLAPRDRKQRLLNLAIGLDQLAWVIITLGHGHPDETISAALWRMELASKWQGRLFRPVVDALFWPLEADHCFMSYLSEKYGRQLPAEYRQ